MFREWPDIWHEMLHAADSMDLRFVCEVLHCDPFAAEEESTVRTDKSGGFDHHVVGIVRSQ
jgi:hypothetical protein